MLVAGCGKGEVTLTFDANGGTGTMEPLVLREGETVELTKNAFERDGYEFDGWSEGADGTGQHYLDGQNVTGTDDGTLYAQWERLPEKAGSRQTAPHRTEENELAASVVESTGELIILEANHPGEYGREFTSFGGGSYEDTTTQMGWFVPTGAYTLTVVKANVAKLTVWYGITEPSMNAAGVPESLGFECVSLEPGESAEIVVPKDGCVYITAKVGTLKLVRH
jgi:uncharacterized repeat protein (TIGR02543 family)